MRSVVELLKVCDSQPDKRVGISDMRDVAVGEYTDIDGWMSDTTLSGRSGRVRVRGISVGSIITGGSSNPSSDSSSGSGGLVVLSSLVSELDVVED